MGLLVLSLSCTKKELPVDTVPLSINEYVSKQKITPNYTNSGLGYLIESPGNEVRATLHSTVRLKITVRTTDETVVAQSNGETYINLIEQVDGLVEGIQLIGEGGKITLYMPYQIGWGAFGFESIPGKADVIVDVSLFSVLVTMEEYIDQNKITTTKTLTSEIQILIEEEGDGSFPTSKSDVRVIYKGYLTNGEVFDNTDGLPIEFNLESTIPGLNIGLQEFDKGAKGQIFIPFFYGYGFSGYSTIPGYADLIFDIELVDFE